MLLAHSDLEQVVSLLGASASSIKQTGPLLHASQRRGRLDKVVYLATAGAQLRRAVINLFIVIPLAPGTGPRCLQLPARQQGAWTRRGIPLHSSSVPALLATCPVSGLPELRTQVLGGGKEPSGGPTVSQNSPLILAYAPRLAALLKPHFRGSLTFHTASGWRLGPGRDTRSVNPQSQAVTLFCQVNLQKVSQISSFTSIPNAHLCPSLAFILSCPGSCLSLRQALPAPGLAPPGGVFLKHKPHPVLSPPRTIPGSSESPGGTLRFPLQPHHQLWLLPLQPRSFPRYWAHLWAFGIHHSPSEALLESVSVSPARWAAPPLTCPPS